jgi:hypothetical protein
MKTMAAFFGNRITQIWAGLVAATLFSWGSVTHMPAVGKINILTLWVVVIAFVKVRYIGLDFMELRQAPTAYRVCFEVWVVLICTAVLCVWGLG